MFLEVKTPRFLCIGNIYSSSFNACVRPIEIASCPIPENHFDIFPCLNRINIFSSISLDFIIPVYNSTSFKVLTLPISYNIKIKYFLKI